MGDKLKMMMDNNGTLKFFLDLAKTLLIAAIIGAITMYAGTAKMSMQIDNLQQIMVELKKEIQLKDTAINIKLQQMETTIHKVDDRLTDHMLDQYRNRR